MKELARKVILDLGCMRNVVGVDWANDVVREWQQHDRWLKALPEVEIFRFGDGNTLKSKYRLQLESTFGGKRVSLAFSVVPGPCPPLLSKQSHTALGVQLDTEKHVLKSRKLRIQNYGLSENNAGHYTVRIDEFHLVDILDNAERKTWKMDAHAEVALFDELCEREVFGSQVDQDRATAEPPLNVFGSAPKPSHLPAMWQCGASDVTMSGDVGPRGGQLILGGESADRGESSPEDAGGRDPPGGAARKGTKRAASSDGGRSEPADRRGPDEGSRQRASAPSQSSDGISYSEGDLTADACEMIGSSSISGWEHGRAGEDGGG
jgi:hypothetical protein